MSTNYPPEKTRDIRRRRMAWVPSLLDHWQNLLLNDACNQLELAQGEIDRLTSLMRNKDAELDRHREEAKMAWEIVTAHYFPEEYSEIAREEEED